MILTNKKLFQRVAFRLIYLCQDHDRLQSTETLKKSVFAQNLLKYKVIVKIPLGFCPPQKLMLFPILQKFWPFLSCWTKCCEMLKYFRPRCPFSRILPFYKSKDMPHYMEKEDFLTIRYFFHILSP